jgi:hypothetical protein
MAAMLLRVAGRRVTNTRGLNLHVRTRLHSTASGGPTYNPVRVGLRGLYGATLAATAYNYYQAEVDYTAVLERAARYSLVPFDLVPLPAFIGNLEGGMRLQSNRNQQRI